MKITIESTDQMVTIEAGDGGTIPARVWRGRTEQGVECQVLVTRIAVPRGADNNAFERELQECPPTRAEGPHAYDLHYFID